MKGAWVIPLMSGLNPSYDHPSGWVKPGLSLKDGLKPQTSGLNCRNGHSCRWVKPLKGGLNP